MSPPAGRDAALSATRALCLTCGQLCDAKIVQRGQEIHLLRWCPEHGPSEALVSSDAAWYLASLAYVKPGTRPLARAVAQAGTCPEACGLCPEHQQHTCVPILEITGRCDLDCPVCLVGHRRATEPELTLTQVERIGDALVRYEGRINMLTLSGGEPTRHPQLLALVDALRRPEVGMLSLSTNGLRLARDPALLAALVERQVVISLQFDGSSPEVSQRLRGRADLPALKLELIERIAALGGRISLTYTLVPGLNEAGLAEALRLLYENDAVVSLMVQPVACTGQVAQRLGLDEQRPLTLPDAIRHLVAGAAGSLAVSDFTPLPCSHPTCFALTYLLKTTAGTLVPLPRLVEPGPYLDIIKNQALMGTDLDTLLQIKDALYSLWSSDGQMPERDVVLATVRRLLLDLNDLRRDAGHQELIDVGVRNVKSIFIHDFMDRATFDLSRAIKCCNHYPQADGRLLPACVRNNLGAPPRAAAAAPGGEA